MPNETINRKKNEEHCVGDDSTIHFSKVIKDIPVCCICTAQLLDDLTVEEQCRNVFHNSCIERWMKQSQQCPICKAGCTKKSFLPIRYEIKEKEEIPESELQTLSIDELYECLKQYKALNEKMQKEYATLTEEMHKQISTMEKTRVRLHELQKTLALRENECFSLRENYMNKETKNAQLLAELEEHKKELRKYEMVLVFLQEIKGNAKEHFLNRSSEQQLTDEDKKLILGHYVESLEEKNKTQMKNIKKLEKELQEYKKKEEHLKQQITELKMKIFMNADDIDCDDLGIEIETQQKSEEKKKKQEEIIIKNKNIRRIEKDKLNSSLKNLPLQKRNATSGRVTTISSNVHSLEKKKARPSEKELFAFDYNAHVINGNNPNSSFCLGKKPETPITQRSLLNSSSDFQTFMGKNFPNLNASPLKKGNSVPARRLYSNDVEDMSNRRINLFMQDTQIENVNKCFEELTPLKKNGSETEPSSAFKYSDSPISPDRRKSDDSSEKITQFYLRENSRILHNRFPETKEQEESQYEEENRYDSVSTLNNSSSNHCFQRGNDTVVMNLFFKKSKTDNRDFKRFIGKNKIGNSNHKISKSKTTMHLNKRRKTTTTTQIHKITDFFKPLQQ